jgi:F-type H+-transporting ATPase subunit delta
MKEIVAKRYARALIQIGREDGHYETYGQQLKAFDAVLQESGELRAVMENPIYNRDQKKAIFNDLKDKLRLSPSVINFIMLLIDKRRLGYFSEIVRCYDRMADDLAGRTRALVISAVPLEESSIKVIQEKLASITGKEVLISAEEDPDLIGGIVTHVGDVVYDGSVRTQLESLKERLVKG